MYALNIIINIVTISIPQQEQYIYIYSISITIYKYTKMAPERCGNGVMFRISLKSSKKNLSAAAGFQAGLWSSTIVLSI